MAALVWDRLGDCDNYIEAFAGSCAVLLLRPTTPKIETVNDLDCMVANFWRATATCPELVAEWADGPVNEADLHARHRWLVLSPYAAEFRQRMRTEPGYFDARVAGWWCWGLCCWIGSGWCMEPDSGRTDRVPGGSGDKKPRLMCGHGGDAGQGVHAKGQDDRKPRLDGGEGQYGHGVHAKGELHQKRPRAHRQSGGGSGGTLPGVLGENHSVDGLSQQLPMLTGHTGSDGRGVHDSRKANRDDNHRPQLADAYSRGRGIHGNDEAGTCEQRRAWLLDWFGRLRDRFRTVRVCCGDWSRVCSSESVTTRLGTCGVFLDPPYSDEAGRDRNLYAVDSGTVAHDVRAWCLERGADPMMRIALCGYSGEGHEALQSAGWEVVEWATAGGYGNRSAKGKANAKKERLWFSPHCLKDHLPLFGDLS